MRAHNTNIAKRHSGCRLPHETAGAGTVYSAPGEVIAYTMSPEELAKYGPVSDTRPPRKKLDRDVLAELLKKYTVGQVAANHGIPQKIVFELVEKYGLELDDKNRLKGDGDVARKTKLEKTMEKLPKEKYAEMIAQDMTDGEIAKSLSLDHEAVKRLKRKYGLTKPGQIGRPKKESAKMPPFETYPGDVKPAKVEPAEVLIDCGPVNVPEPAPARREKISIGRLIELRVLLGREVQCHEEVDERTADVEFSPGVKGILNQHFDECRNRLAWIDKVFAETVVEVPSDQA